MEKNLYLKIDDDVSRAVLQISKERASDITLVLPKESWLLRNLTNLKMLKKHADELGKNISILTNDREGQQRAKEVGFELKTMEVLKRGGAPMDVISRKHRQPAWQAMYPNKSESHKPEPAKKAVELPVFGKTSKPQPVIAEPPPAIVHPTVPLAPVVPAPVPVVETFIAPQPTPQPEVVLPVAAPIPAPIVSAEPKLIPKRAVIEPVPENYELDKPSYKKGIIFLFISVILAVFVLGFVVLPKANVIVYAHSQPISRDLQANLDKNAPSPDPKNLILPAKVLDSNQQISKQFNSSGIQNVGITAQGTVQIYNFTGKTLKLGAATTKFSVGTKTYHLVKDATGIKPTKKFANGTDVDPASLTPEVAIVADQPGDDYNFPGGTRLDIQNDILGSIPDKLYAQSTKPIAGGVSRYQNIISQDDLDKASAQLKQDAIDAAKQVALQKDNDTLLDSAATVQVLNTFFDKKVGDSAVSFTGTITADVKGLEFNLNDLQSMIRDRVSLTLDTGKSLAAGSDESFKVELKSSDLNLGTGILAVTYQGKVISTVDTNGIEAEIRGKSPSEVKEILLSDPNIDGVDLTLKPFWVTKVPSLFGNVNVTTQVK